MADITFSCNACGETLQAPDDFAGETVECPTCSAELVVPSGNQPEQSVDTGNKCSNCGSAMEPEAVLCVSCGFHSGLGKVIETSFE